MNELITEIINKDFPVLWRYKDLKKLDLKKAELDDLLKDAIIHKNICNIYSDIYTLEREFRKSLVSECVLAQMIVPNSYVSTYYVLSDVSWIPENVHSVSSITAGKNMLVDTELSSSFSYTNIYGDKDIVPAGIYKEKNDNGTYWRATPLRALCDYLFMFKRTWTSIGLLEDHLRISSFGLDELTSKDFNELQGKFKIANIENFLAGIRKELGL